MNTPLNILVIEDNQDDFRLVELHLRKHGLAARCHCVANLEDLEAAIEHGGWDIVLSDFNLPMLNFQDTLNLIQARNPDLPLILVSGGVGEEKAVELLKLGVSDFVLKDSLVRLVAAIERSLREANARRARDAAEVESREKEARLSIIFHHSPIGIVMSHTADGKIVDVNEAFAGIYGYTRDEMISHSSLEINMWEDPSDRAAMIKRLNEKGTCRDLEIKGRKKSGELRDLLVSAELLELEGGQFMLALVRDITEYKLLNEQFLRAQRLENIGTLASGIAHDLNNILAPIMMASSMLEDDLPQETRHKLVTSIYEAAQRGSDIVKQVLTFARGVDGNRVALRPELLIAQVGRILRETFPKAIAFTESMPEGLWTVSGDATQLHQVLLNLCVNARDAMMPDGGTLAITATNVEIDENYAAMSIDVKPGRYVVMKVIDSGCGMPASIIQKIFDPFFTTKEAGQGTGLGLSTVVGIVKSHNGFVEVESEEGRGSVFRVYIPAAAERELEAGQAIQAVAPRGNGETVLLIDDEAEILKVASLTLTQNGYMVLTAADGIEALTAYVKNSELIRVVVTDVMMPMMDGVNLTRALKKINPDVQIIASSGHAEASQRNELSKEGIHAFLEKPFNNYQLLKAVHTAIC